MIPGARRRIRGAFVERSQSAALLSDLSWSCMHLSETPLVEFPPQSNRAPPASALDPDQLSRRSSVVTVWGRPDRSASEPLRVWRETHSNAASIRSSVEPASTKRETTAVWSRGDPGPIAFTLAVSQDMSPDRPGKHP